MKIKYNISDGVAPFIATLSGSSGILTNNHPTIGTFQFTSVANGIYKLTVVDSVNCEFVSTTLNVNNSLFIISAVEVTSATPTANIKEITYNLGFNPLLAETVTGSIDIDYILSIGSFAATNVCSITLFKNNVLVSQEFLVGAPYNKSGTFTVSFLPTDTLSIRLYVNNTDTPGALVESEFTVDNLMVNNNTVTFDGSLATKSLSIT